MAITFSKSLSNDVANIICRIDINIDAKILGNKKGKSIFMKNNNRLRYREDNNGKIYNYPF